jgi:hypothetical protein
MTTLFEDFICRLIEVQSGAISGKDQPTSHIGFNRFVHDRRMNKGKEAAARAEDPKKKAEILAAYRHHAMDVFKQHRKDIIKKNMAPPKRKPERFFGLLDNG